LRTTQIAAITITTITMPTKMSTVVVPMRTCSGERLGVGVGDGSSTTASVIVAVGVGAGVGVAVAVGCGVAVGCAVAVGVAVGAGVVGVAAGVDCICVVIGAPSRGEASPVAITA
jgi:hypothetical protein